MWDRNIVRSILYEKLAKWLCDEDITWINEYCKLTIITRNITIKYVSTRSLHISYFYVSTPLYHFESPWLWLGMKSSCLYSYDPGNLRNLCDQSVPIFYQPLPWIYCSFVWIYLSHWISPMIWLFVELVEVLSFTIISY